MKKLEEFGSITEYIVQLGIEIESLREEIKNLKDKNSMFEKILFEKNNKVQQSAKPALKIPKEYAHVLNILSKHMVHSKYCNKKASKSKDKLRLYVNKIFNLNLSTHREFQEYVIGNVKSLLDLKTHNNPEYETYLHSSKWKNIRKLVLERDGNKCTECDETRNLHIHHKTYENIFNEENHLEDLITLCESCHEKKHPDKIKNSQ
jgi:uncharacterized protein YdcH (DUF465 family)